MRLSLLALVGLSACLPASSSDSATPAPAPSGGGDWASIVGARVQAEGRAIYAVDGGFAADLPSRRQARLDGAGARISDEDGAVLGVRTVGWGREGAMLPVGTREAAFGACTDETKVSGECVQRLELAEPGLTEWWASEARGLEQGWEIERAPVGEGPVVLEVALDGADGVTADGVSASLVDAVGEAWSVESLAAWDARGELLPARIVAEDGGVRIEVDDAGAEYPITVDPVYTTAAWSVTGHGADAAFGGDIAWAGDVNADGYDDVIVGAYNSNSATGAAHIFYGGASGLSATPASSMYGTSTGEHFGANVDGAGDVNGDGYDDVIVGAWAYSSNKGRAYVFLGSSGGVSGTPVATFTGTTAGDKLGQAVAGVGDVNGDGYDDIGVGSPGAAGGAGVATVYHGAASGVGTASFAASATGAFGSAIDGVGDTNNDGYDDVVIGAPSSGSSGSVGWIPGSAGGLVGASVAWTAGPDGASLGFAVAGAGDLDGDGYDDFVAGGPTYSVSRGVAEVCFGHSYGPTCDVEHVGTSAGGRFGHAVAGGGDINGDGRPDVLVGAYLAASGFGQVTPYSHGTVALSAVTGPASGSYFGAAVAIAPRLNGDAYADALFAGEGVGTTGAAYAYYGSGSGWSGTTTLSGVTSSEWYGYAVSGVGDLNGDGYDEVAVGASQFGGGAGRLYLYQGSASGPATTPTRMFTGATAGDQLGTAVTGADLNNDGYGDLVVGAPGYSSYTGRAYVYSGGTGGLAATPTTITGDASSSSFGSVVADAGDTNGDGFHDLLITAPYHDATATNAGKAYLYRGGATGVSTTASWTRQEAQAGGVYGGYATGAGDVNGDGYDDLAISAYVYDSGSTDEGKVWLYLGSATGPSSAIWSMEPDQASADMGVVIGAGDVDGDGYDDVVVAAERYDNGQTDEGKAWLYLGSATGLGATAAWSVEGNVASARLGLGLAAAGDVNGDGFDDVLVGVPYLSNGTTNEGRVDLYQGSASGLATTATYSAESGTANELWGYAVDGAGDVNGDGYDDIIVGGYGGSDNGKVEIHYGYPADADGDGTTEDHDCNDANASIGVATAWYADTDGDGFGAGAATSACTAPSGYVATSSDCDNSSAAVHPGATEVCDSVDNNCDGVTDTDAIDRAAWHPDADLDGYGDSGSSTLACTAPSGDVADGSDCDDADDAIHPGATEVCDSLDNDCNGDVDTDAVDGFAWLYDMDGDSWGDDVMGGDTTCAVPTYAAFVGGDCNDYVDTIHPYADETCNGADDDCDGPIDEAGAVDAPAWFADADGDSYGDASASTASCAAPSGYVTNSTDCDDAHAANHPGATESCDHADNDCDGLTDEAGSTGEATFFVDADFDGYGDSSRTTSACWESAGAAAMDGDCDDTVATTNPGALEYCNEVDDDCNDIIDDPTAEDAEIFYRDVDGDGFGNRRRPVLTCEAPSGYVTDHTDCRDTDATAYPGALEACDSVDDDCDGTVDEAGSTLEPAWYTDADGDSYGAGVASYACTAPSGKVATNTDCNDSVASISPAGTEACNDVDDDCDGTIDEAGATGESSWYVDADGDTYGNPVSAVLACDPVSGRVAVAGDCDDANVAAYPGAPERCDGVQNNCSISWTAASENREVWLQSGTTWTRYTATWGAGTSSSPATLTLPANGTLWVCDGTYYVRATASASGNLTVASLYGPDGVTLSAGGSSSVVQVTGSGTTLTLDGLTLTGGAGSAVPTRGGAIRQSAGTLYVDSCVLEGNTAVRGGGLAEIGGTATVTDSEILDNVGTTGGGVYLAGGTVTLTGTTVQGNDAQDGGGFYHQTGTWTLSTSDLLDNTATRWGGGLFASNSGTLGASTVQGNSAPIGGGVYYAGTGGTLALTNSLVSTNTATTSGGGLYSSGGLVACTGSSSVSAGFLSNTAPTGGGVYLPLKRATLSSTSCDFGSTTGNNSPQDVLYQATAYNKNDDATFTCTGGVCY